MAKRVMPKVDIDEYVAEQEKPTNLFVAHCASLNVRKDPGRTPGNVSFVLAAGSRVVVDGMAGEWLHVYLPNDKNKTGYVLARFVSEE